MSERSLVSAATADVVITSGQVEEVVAQGMDGPISESFGVPLKVGRMAYIIEGKRAEAVAGGIALMMQGALRRYHPNLEPIHQGNTDQSRLVLFAGGAKQYDRSDIEDYVLDAKDATNDILAAVQSPYLIPPVEESDAIEAAEGSALVSVTRVQIPLDALDSIRDSIYDQTGVDCAADGFGYSLNGEGAGYVAQGMSLFLGNMALTQGHTRDGLAVVTTGSLEANGAGLVIVSDSMQGQALHDAANRLIPHANQVLSQLDSPYSFPVAS